MLIFFYMDLTGWHKKTTPVTLSMITENGDTFYAEFTDYDKTQCEYDNFIQKHVIKRLIFNEKNNIREFGKDAKIKAKRSDVAMWLNDWLEFVRNGENVQFVSMACCYDFVVLIDIITYGKQAIVDTPEWISPVCHDIIQDVSRYYGISDLESYENGWEEFVDEQTSIDSYAQENMNGIFNQVKMYKAIFEAIAKKG